MQGKAPRNCKWWQGWHARASRPECRPRFGEIVVWSGELRLAGWLIAMSPFLTSKENIVVNLIYEWLRESRINRTYDEYTCRSRRAFRRSWRAMRTSISGFAKWRMQEMRLSKFATLKREIGTFGMRIFRLRYRGKLCAVRYSR